jgi:peptidyl-prolyl cis-trans isomerase B (cyclophilin B)
VTRKQERARARRRYEKRQVSLARRAEDRARLRVVGVMAGVVGVAVVVLALLGATFSTVQPAAARTLAGCELPPPSLGTGADLELPDKDAVAGRQYTATVTTNCGDIVIDLDAEAAPQAVASFIQLAEQNYWVDGPCHRLTTQDSLQVLQCGDPTGTGQGSPGYGFAVENAPEDGRYPRGTVAMARTSDPQEGNGGQFFIVYGDTELPDPDGYTVFGTVTSGLDIVDREAAAGVAPGGSSADDGPPAAPISILRVAVTEKKA